MRSYYAIGFLVLICLDTLGHVAFKLTAMDALPVQADGAWILRILSVKWVYVAIVAYVGTFFVWTTLLKHVPVGPAFAATHLDVVAVLFVSVMCLGETLTLRQVTGAVLILSGVALLSLKERDTR